MDSFRLLVFEASWAPRQDMPELPSGLVLERIEADIRQDLSLSFRIIDAPTLILLREGLECWRQLGRRPASELRHALLTLITSEPMNPVWLTWNDSLIPKMAKVMDREKRFADLPILADALEEAGCTNVNILNHCRQPGEHVRGCWVVDLILGKS